MILLFDKNMQLFLISFCCALFMSVPVYTLNGNEVRRGSFPFMAYIYFPDKMVLDVTDLRFLRAAVLIRPNWLISSAIDTLDGQSGFPEKTLLVRMGAITIDANFTLNEDENEQEREIITIVRPYERSEAQWWYTDISLLKTLVPFNMTSAVTIMPSMNSKPRYSDKICSMLIFAKGSNVSEEKVLMQFMVELLPFTEESCGDHYHNETMACAIYSNENKMAVPTDFCQGNNGGPLLCDGHVFGIQTYIENNCRTPYLYQLLSAWEHFINCGTGEKCDTKACNKVCKVTNKDSPATEQVYHTSASEEPKIVSFETEDTSATHTENTTTKIADTTLRTVASDTETENITIATTIVTSSEPPPETSTKTTTKKPLLTRKKILTTEAQTSQYESSEPAEESTTWKEKFQEYRKTLDSAEDIGLNENVDEPVIENTKKKTKSAAERNNLCIFQSLLIAFLVLTHTV